MEVTLSILIGTMNRLPILKKTLEALVGGVKVPHEIIVIDAGSTDGTLDYLRQFKGITLVNDGQLMGQAKSLNRVIQKLNSRFMCWLSDDNVVVEGMLDEAVRILQNDPHVGMVSLKVRDVTGHFSDVLPYVGGIWSGILNCNQGVLPTQLMQEFGGFDEEFRDYGIDIDLTTRVLLTGHKVVFTKKVAIQHYRDYETNTWIDPEARKERLKKAQVMYENKYPFLKKRRTRVSKFINGIKSRLLSVIYVIYKWMKERDFSLEQLIGINERDWQNVFLSRYISRWDFLLNIWKPYYLVQKIPAHKLARFAKEIIHSKNS